MSRANENGAVTKNCVTVSLPVCVCGAKQLTSDGETERRKKRTKKEQS